MTTPTTTMTKSEVTDEFAAICSMPRERALRAIDGSFGHIADQLTAGREVILPGIGKLMPKATKAGKGRNPRTGEPIDVPAGYRVTFRQGKAMRDRMAARAPSRQTAE